MADVEIRPLALHDPGVILDIACIGSAAGFTFAIDKLTSNLLDSSPDTICFGAFLGNELAAVNAFLAHEVLIGGVRTVAYQSGWSATIPSHQGKGLFRDIINHAKVELASRGASFIFGYPNPVSEPIFLKKLGFARIPMKRVLLPTFPATTGVLIDTDRYFDALASSATVRFNQYQNHAWKQHEHADLLFFEDYTNIVWGQIGDRKLPLLGNRKVLLAGGCEINKPQLFGQLLKKLRSRHRVDLVRFVAAEGSMIASSARFALSGDKTEPFIYFPLRDFPADARFDAHVGLKDAY